MIKFVIDEDLPRSISHVIKDAGYDVIDIRDYGLRGADDKRIFEFAQQEKAVLLSGDVEFGNIIQFPLGKHFGIIILHFPNELSTKEINRQFSERLKDLSYVDFKGNLIIIEPGRIRIRKLKL